MLRLPVYSLTARGKRCVGVEYVQDGQPKKAFAGSEVIVCLGALESPHLLLNSGIGRYAAVGSVSACLRWWTCPAWARTSTTMC